MKKITYQQLTQDHFEQIIELGNFVHGENYMDLPQLKNIYTAGIRNHVNASWVALDEEKVVGFRLTIAAGNWHPDKWCSPELWQAEVDNVCYFKCNTVNADYRGYGIGSELLMRSIDKAKAQGSTAGLAHIWMASPGNSAYRYFTKCGGEMVKEHPGKWLENCIEEDYNCPICGKECTCVAGEMILYFK